MPDDNGWIYVCWRDSLFSFHLQNIFLRPRIGVKNSKVVWTRAESLIGWSICCQLPSSWYLIIIWICIVRFMLRQHTYIQPLSSGIILCWYCLYSCLLPNEAIFTFPFPMLNKSFVAKPLSCYQRGAAVGRDSNQLIKNSTSDKN